jgi:hypothetical protein
MSTLNKWAARMTRRPERQARSLLSRNYSVEMGSARAPACRGRRPRRPLRRTRTHHHSVIVSRLRSDRRGASRNTRGRVCSPIPTAYLWLRACAFWPPFRWVGFLFCVAQIFNLSFRRIASRNISVKADVFESADPLQITNRRYSAARRSRNQRSAGLRPAALRNTTDLLGNKRASALAGPLRLTEPRSKSAGGATIWTETSRVQPCATAAPAGSLRCLCS